MPEWIPGRALDAEIARLRGWFPVAAAPLWSTDEDEVGSLLAWLGKQEWFEGGSYDFVDGRWRFAIDGEALNRAWFVGIHVTLSGALALAAREALAAMEKLNPAE